MTLSWKLGRISGIDVYLHWSLLILAAIGLLQLGTSSTFTYVAFFGCILAHELGHALAARRYRIETEDITLYPIGGIARLRRMPRAAGAELAIALAGPAVNVAIALGLYGVSMVGGGAGSRGAAWVGAMMRLNMGLALFNLVPAFPMDGGRIFRALLSGRLGRLPATEIAVRLGQGLAIGLGILGLCMGWQGVPYVVIATFVFLAAAAELSHARVEACGDDRGRLGLLDVPAGNSWIYQGNGVWQCSPLVVGADDRIGFRRWGSWP